MEGISIYGYIENATEYLPENVLESRIEQGWKWMTDNYSKFQIATWGSLILHEV